MCGIEIGSDGDTLIHKGVKHRFCCATCRWAFEQNPDQYMAQRD